MKVSYMLVKYRTNPTLVASIGYILGCMCTASHTWLINPWNWDKVRSNFPSTTIFGPLWGFEKSNVFYAKIMELRQVGERVFIACHTVLFWCLVVGNPQAMFGSLTLMPRIWFISNRVLRGYAYTIAYRQIPLQGQSLRNSRKKERVFWSNQWRSCPRTR